MRSGKKQYRAAVPPLVVSISSVDKCTSPARLIREDVGKSDKRRKSERKYLSIDLALLLLFDLEQQRTVDTRQNTTISDSGANQSVEFLVTTDGELQVTRCDTLDFEILGGVACQFEDFGSEVFENGCDIDGSYACY